MVALEVVEASNAKLRELGPVGATSGIGEATAKAFVQNTISPRVYIVGRSAPAAERIIKECEVLNKDGQVSFLKADVSELGEVDRVCELISKKESKINLLVQSQGNMNLRGRDENPEGLDRKFTLNYYSRMRFISNLLPSLKASTTSPPHFSRVLTILGAGHGGRLNFSDLELKNTFSGVKCAAHSMTMMDFMMEEHALQNPEISFIHASPGTVNTELARELPLWARGGMKILTILFKPLMVGIEETGKRQLFIATSGMFPPKSPVEGGLASGVPVQGQGVAKGADGMIGSGAYLVNWDGGVVAEKDFKKEYREKGTGKTVWEHTMAVFAKLEKTT
ncbi:hypothetical protein B7494_g3465 [Chlorociboria aeruginascens]|nr:hypothetical protein B7494_g3465 [Chlorociboria aeruginascens]